MFHYTLSIVLIFICFCTYGNTKCSLNGFKIYTINGVFSDELSMQPLRENVNNNKQEIELFSKVKVDYISNKSVGLTEDIALLFALKYNEINNSSNGIKVFYETVNSKVEKFKNINKIKYFTNSYYRNVRLKAKSLSTQYANNKFLSDKANIAKINDLNLISEEKINSIMDLFQTDINSKKKVLIVGHSQGNALINEAIKRLAQSPINKQYMQSYFGLFSVGSPVSLISSEYIKRKYMLYTNDWISSIANEIFPLFNKENGNYVALINNEDEYNHRFDKSYYSNNKILKSNVEYISKDELMKILKELNSELANNCGEANLKISSSEVGVEINELFSSYIKWTSPIPIAGANLRLTIKDVTQYPYETLTDYFWEITSLSEQLVNSGTGSNITVPVNLNTYGRDYKLKVFTKNNLGIEGFYETWVSVVPKKECFDTKFSFGETGDGGWTGSDAVVVDCGGQYSCGQMGVTITLNPTYGEVGGFSYVFSSANDFQRMYVARFPIGSGGKVYDAHICQNSFKDGDVTNHVGTSSNVQMCQWYPELCEE